MLELCSVTRRFGAATAVDGVSLAVPEGSFTALLGPSGCGKSTTLRLMAGLDRPTEGTVRMAGEDVTDRTASERNVAMVFQAYALYPHMTARQNIALPLAMRRLGRLGRSPLGRWTAGAARRRIAEDVARAAAMLGIEPLLDRKPAQLSGGQQQRVALGRALVRDPSLFLLDEPLSNLDAALRVQMRGELTALHRRTGAAFVYVTHDQAEAMSMADRIAVMLAGRIAQLGTPRDLYARPATRQVAAFIGAHPINLVEVAPGHPLAPPGLAGPATLGVRPEHLRLAGPATAQVERIEYLGAEALAHLRLGDTPLRALLPGDAQPPEEGASTPLGLDPARAHLFDAQGRRISGSKERAA